ncbi:hypothetical protein I315_06784 [Cryptococcus gattii Ru294]|nr:hypothetical protein I315_06784 [Cryptococcus gattii Ru294]
MTTPQAEAAKQGAAAKRSSSSSATSASGDYWSREKPVRSFQRSDWWAGRFNLPGFVWRSRGCGRGQDSSGSWRTRNLGATKGILMTSKKDERGGEELPHLYRGLFPQSVPSRIRAHVRQSTGSNKPIESSPCDQNEHLKHSPASSSDKAKGDAGENLIFLVARVRTRGVEAKVRLRDRTVARE